MTSRNHAHVHPRWPDGVVGSMGRPLGDALRIRGGPLRSINRTSRASSWRAPRVHFYDSTWFSADAVPSSVRVSDWIDRRKCKKRHSPAIPDHLSKKQMIGSEVRGEQNAIASRVAKSTSADFPDRDFKSLYRKRAITPSSRTPLASTRFRYNTRTSRY